MPGINYSKTIIYSITCKDSNVHYNYVGGTTKLRQVKMEHCRKTKSQILREPYTVFNRHGGWDNWKINILESYKDCKNKAESNNRVYEWKSKLDAMKHELSSENIANINKIICDKKIINEPQKTETGHICQWCSKSYSRSYSVKRHETKCKNKPNENMYTVKLEKLEKLVEQLSQQLVEQNKKGKDKKMYESNIERLEKMVITLIDQNNKLTDIITPLYNQNATNSVKL